MKDNNDIEKEPTIEIPLLKSDLIKKLYNTEKPTEDNIEKLEIVTESNTNTTNKSEELLLTTPLNIEKLKDNQESKPNDTKKTNDIICNNVQKSDDISSFNEKNNKELNKNTEINIEKTKVFNYKDFEKNMMTAEKIEEKIEKETKKEKKKIIKHLIPVSLFVLILLSIITVKNYSYSFKLDQYEEDTKNYDKNIDATVKIYEGNNLNYESYSNNAANSLVKCLNSKVDVNNLPENIENVVNKINNYYNESNNHFAFAYKDLYTGFSVTYNESQQVFTASTIKAPTDLYIYEMASLGKINLDEEMTYTSNYYNPKSGKLKFNEFNTKYTVRELLRLSTVYSDNAAHNMLEDKFGRVNMLNFWKEKGTEYIFTQNTNWGVLNAHDALIYMEELYNFYLTNEEYGGAIMENFKNASPKFIKGKNDYPVANKSGWGNTSIHDVSIIFAENPYIVVALSTLGKTDIYKAYFEKVNNLAYELHTEYWKYKTESCSNIKQY